MGEMSFRQVESSLVEGEAGARSALPLCARAPSRTPIAGLARILRIVAGWEDFMAQTGALFRTVQRLVQELEPTSLTELRSPPLPVRLDIDSDGTVSMGLLVTMAAVDPADRE